MVAEVDGGGLASTSATVGELLDRWQEHASDDFSPKTALETRGFVDRDIKPALGSVRLAKLRAADLDRFYAELRRRAARVAARFPSTSFMIRSSPWRSSSLALSRPLRPIAFERICRHSFDPMR